MESVNMQIINENQSLILKEIVAEKAVSRAELSTLTGLSKPAVSSNVTELLEKNLINESHLGVSTERGGRKPLMLKFNEEVYAVICINIYQREIVGELRYTNGSLINRITTSNQEVTSGNVIELLKKLIDQIIEEKPKKIDKVPAISIAVHGIVVNNKIRFTPNYDLDEVDLYSELRAIYEKDIYINNEANLAAVGEYTFKTLQESLINVNIHSGVGAGVILEGELILGDNGAVGEIGHSIVYVNGKKCSCGSSGCLEQYVSDDKVISEVSSIVGIHLTNLSQVAEYWYAGISEVKELLISKAKLLGVGVNNIISCYDPAMLIINNELYALIPDLINYVEESARNRFNKNTVIVVADNGDNSTMLGCVAVVNKAMLGLGKI